MPHKKKTKKEYVVVWSCDKCETRGWAKDPLISVGDNILQALLDHDIRNPDCDAKDDRGIYIRLEEIK